MKEKTLNIMVEWLINGNTGVSSKTLCAAFCGINYMYSDAPHDGSDFSRCEDFIELLDPEDQQQALAAVSEISPTWAEIVDRWDELCSMESKLDLYYVLKDIRQRNRITC